MMREILEIRSDVKSENYLLIENVNVFLGQYLMRVNLLI
jgi:hypothetical protein